MQYYVLVASGLVGMLGWASLAVSAPAGDIAVVRATSAPQPVSISSPIVVEVLPTAATAYVVFDVATGEVLLDKNAHTKLPIASITKLFTAAQALESGQLETVVEVTANDVATFGRAGNLYAGQQLTLRELLFPLLLESSNDAAAAVERMIGLGSPAGVSIADASGLSDKNQASAENLALAVRGLYVETPHMFDITRLPQYLGNDAGWVNNSPVYHLPGYQGGKHGYTDAARGTLVAFFAEPALGGRTLGYTVLGSDDVRGDVEMLRAAVSDFKLGE